jgi:SOS-response transcriptional repressor LexA
LTQAVKNDKMEQTFLIVCLEYMSKTDQVLQFVREFVSNHGYSPSYRQIAAGCEIGSLSSVKMHLDHLQAAGKLRFDRSVSRSIVLSLNESNYQRGQPPGV